MASLKTWITEHVKLELDVLRGKRCRVCYVPLEQCADGLCGCSACSDEAALQEEDRELSAGPSRL